MAKSRPAKRRRDRHGKGRSTELASDAPDQTVDNIAPADDTDDNISPSDNALLASRSPDETVSADDLPDPDADIVFQCASCRSIVGDTQSEYQARFEFETLSLKAASNVTVRKELHISKTGFDAGSLVSYQLGSSKTIDGQYAVNPGSQAKHRQQTSDAAPAAHQGVSSEAFDALDVHVGNLTDATNKLTEAFDQNKDSISEMKQIVDSTNESFGELRAGLEHVQNMLLLWEERFQRLDACEQALAKLTSDCSRYDICERRVRQLEEIIRNSNLAGTRGPTGHPQTAPMKVMQPLGKSASPARSSLKRRRQ